MAIFADDTNKYGEVLEENYELDLKQIETWMEAIKLTINQDKTKTIVFSSSKKKNVH